MSNVHTIRVPLGKFRSPQKCYVCKGVGWDLCPKCFGRKCPFCKERGLVECYACGGTGIVDD